MTPENAALIELGLSPEALAERTRKMDELAKQQINLATFAALKDAGAVMPEKKRKVRADAGKPHPKRKPVPEAKADTGGLTAEQAIALRNLLTSQERRRVELDAAIANMEDRTHSYEEAVSEVDDYIDSLTQPETGCADAG